MKALFLSPHPDDVELFCGGTVAALARTSEVHVVDLTRGEMSSNGTVELRAAEAAQALHELGVGTSRGQLGLPDAGLDDRHPAHLDAVAGAIADLSADLVFAPWVVDRHPDHVATGELARKAVALLDRRSGGKAGPVRLLHYPCHSGIAPTLLVDVSSTIDRWDAAVRSYASQFLDGGEVATPINRPGFLEHHRSRRAAWGAMRGVEFAEAFVHEGPWPVDVLHLGDR